MHENQDRSEPVKGPPASSSASGASRCSDCKVEAGGQHKPSCHRQGLVTSASDYRYRLCTCHSHQFVACRGKEALGPGWVCEDERNAVSQIHADLDLCPFCGRGIAFYAYDAHIKACAARTASPPATSEPPEHTQSPQVDRKVLEVPGE